MQCMQRPVLSCQTLCSARRPRDHGRCRVPDDRQWRFCADPVPFQKTTSFTMCISVNQKPKAIYTDMMLCWRQIVLACISAFECSRFFPVYWWSSSPFTSHSDRLAPRRLMGGWRSIPLRDAGSGEPIGSSFIKMANLDLRHTGFLSLSWCSPTCRDVAPRVFI